jgi:iron(III) transport system permease protein
MIAILSLASFLLVVLTALPVAVLLITSARPQGKMWLEPAGFTVDNFISLATQPGVVELLTNTGIYVFGTVAIATAFAAVWAWITERTDFRFKVSVRVMMLVTMSLPPLIQGFGWTLLLNPSNGYINHLLRRIFSLENPDGPINVYSIGMMVLVSSFLLAPTVYVMLSGVIKNLDYKLEFPAVLAGVSPITILTRIIAPVLLPGLLSVLIYTVMIMIQVFDIPLSIGLTGGIQVLSTRIYLLSTAELGAPNYNLAAAFGMVLVVAAIILVLIYQRLTKVSEKFSVVSGKNFRFVPTELGNRRYIVYAFAMLFFLIALAPVLILLWTSFLPFYALPSYEALQNVSLQNYADMFQSSVFSKSIVNTVIVVLVGATLTMAISMVVAYSTVRPTRFWSKVVDVLAFMPIAVPHIVLGLAVLLLYVRTPLYGTIGAIILAQVSVNMVFGTRTISSALIQVHRDLERAAEISGVGRRVIMTHVLTPIIRSQIFNGWLLVFAHAMRDLGVPLVFLTSQTVLLSSALWLTWGYPNVPGAAALSVILVMFLALVVTPLQVYISRLDARANN